MTCFPAINYELLQTHDCCDGEGGSVSPVTISASGLTIGSATIPMTTLVAALQAAGIGGGAGTDSQTISISSSGISISNGNTIPMSALTAALIASGLGTDNQGLSLSPTELLISDGTSVPLSGLASALASFLASNAALRGQFVEDAFGVPQGYLLPL